MHSLKWISEVDNCRYFLKRRSRLLPGLTIVMLSLSIRLFYTFEARLHGALNNLLYWKMSLPMVGGLDLDHFQGLFKPRLVCGSVMILEQGEMNIVKLFVCLHFFFLKKSDYILLNCKFGSIDLVACPVLVKNVVFKSVIHFVS